MSTADKQTLIQQKAVEQKIKWSTHGLSELAQVYFDCHSVSTVTKGMA
jgi:hypothetical protein